MTRHMTLMRQLITTCCFAFMTISLNTHAQSIPDGFWDIPWGTSLADAKAKMLIHQGITVDTRLTNANALMCDGGYFNGKQIWKYALLFVDNKLCHAKVILKPTPSQLIFEYREWVADLTKKYGRPQNLWDDSPVRDGNNQIPDLILAGKAHYATTWEFPVNGNPNNTILVEINEALLLTITYENGRLMRERVQMQKAKFGKDL